MNNVLLIFYFIYFVLTQFKKDIKLKYTFNRVGSCSHFFIYFFSQFLYFCRLSWGKWKTSSKNCDNLITYFSQSSFLDPPSLILCVVWWYSLLKKKIPKMQLLQLKYTSAYLPLLSHSGPDVSRKRCVL